MTQTKQPIINKLTAGHDKFISELFEQAEAAKALPKKMLENATVYRVLQEIDSVLYEQANKLGTVDSEPIPASEFAQTVQDLFDEIREDIQMKYDMELTELKYEAFPWED